MEVTFLRCGAIGGPTRQSSAQSCGRIPGQGMSSELKSGAHTTLSTDMHKHSKLIVDWRPHQIPFLVAISTHTKHNMHMKHVLMRGLCFEQAETSQCPASADLLVF